MRLRGFPLAQVTSVKRRLAGDSPDRQLAGESGFIFAFELDPIAGAKE